MEVDNHQQPAEEDNWAARMRGEDIPQQRDMADRGVTFAGQVELPLLVARISHHACPSQSCVVSDFHKEISNRFMVDIMKIETTKCLHIHG